MAEDGHEVRKERFLPDDMSSLTPSEVTAEGKFTSIWTSTNFIIVFLFFKKLQ